MADIGVTRIDNETFQVDVRGTRSTTTHRVTVDPAYAATLAPQVEATTLVEESFRFLLERESKESILRSFELPVIGRYFPEYETEIRSRLS